MPTAWLPNASEVGDRVRIGTRTVPVSDTDCEVAGAAAFTFNKALFVPVPTVVGLKLTLAVHDAPTARVAGKGPQVLV